jgi:hypothetical protein
MSLDMNMNTWYEHEYEYGELIPDTPEEDNPSTKSCLFIQDATRTIQSIDKVPSDLSCTQ